MKKRKVLVVDDEINVCKSIRQSILSGDYEVDMALSGEEALNKDKESLYDLIITDLMMPGMSGLDLLKAIRTIRPEVDFIMVTGYPTIKSAVEAIKIGAFDYIAKPFTPMELRGIVARVFKASEAAETGGDTPPSMPAGLFLMKGHTWLRKDEPNLATLGVVFDFLRPIKAILRIEMPEENKNIYQGEVCARIIDADKSIHRIWSPVTGRITIVNKALGENTSLLKKDPYQKGWLFCIESPTLDRELEDLTVSK